MVPDTRIEPAIGQVDQQIRHENDEGEEQDHGLDSRVVPSDGGVNDAAAQTGQVQIFSWITVPPRSSAYCTPRSVTTGNMAFFKACRMMMTLWRRPLAQAVLM